MLAAHVAKQLLTAASEARQHAYAPYSGFQVGAVLLDAEGRLHKGCNVENGAFGPSNCAERTALYRAIADGCAPHSFQALAVIGDTSGPLSPCGVCRQVLLELCRSEMPVVMGNLAGNWRQMTVGELLPAAFTLSATEDKANKNEES